MYCKIDVFKHGKEDLAKDLLPKLKTEDVDTLLQYLEQDVERLLLMLVCLIKRQIRKVRQDGEPKAFLYTQYQLLAGWVRSKFLFPFF